MRNIILGTDWWTDCDDAVAVRVLARGEKAGLWKVLGININACMPLSAPSLHRYALNEGLDVPISIDLSAGDFVGVPGKIQSAVTTDENEYPNSRCEDPVKMYRRLLSAAEDKSVELIEIGFLQDIAALLDSAPDEISPMTGMELFSLKVSKMWIMGGNYQNESEGHEHNFNASPTASRGASEVCGKCPCPITFLGWEAANSVICGKHLSKDDMLYAIMSAHGSPCGRSSWDPMTVYLALYGPEKAGLGEIRGHVYVDAVTGTNSFIRDAGGNHVYVKKLYDDSWYENLLEDFLA